MFIKKIISFSSLEYVPILSSLRGGLKARRSNPNMLQMDCFAPSGLAMTSGGQSLKGKRSSFKITALILTLLTITPLWAEDEMLLPRISAMEAENRELRGKVEELQHELSVLNKRMETFQSDIEYRLNTPPQDLGQMNVPQAGEAALPPSMGGPLPLLPQAPPPLASENKAPGGGVQEEYEMARSFLEQGDYEKAEQAFTSFIAAHPQDDQAGAAQYWLGVTYFVRGQHEKAAAAFAKGYKNYPKSSKAVDTLLKLAKSLAALGRKDDACTALDQLSADFPKAQAQAVASERQNLGCK